ncbi:MAG: RusA family crossover junction endodeoxyribonuclease [Acetobacterium sp.]
MGGSIRFTIPGAPMGKSSARISKGRFCFNPEKPRDYENRVKMTCSKKCVKGRCDYAGLVVVDITACYSIPSSGIKKKQVIIRSGAGSVKKIELDNIATIIMDALNHVAWQDDKQVVCMVLTKKYAAVPGVSVGIHYLE